MRHQFLFRNDRDLWITAERALHRAILATAGVSLIVLGIILGMTLVMLPIGAFMGLIGAGLTATAITDSEVERPVS